MLLNQRTAANVTETVVTDAPEGHQTTPVSGSFAQPYRQTVYRSITGGQALPAHWFEDRNPMSPTECYQPTADVEGHVRRYLGIVPDVRGDVFTDLPLTPMPILRRLGIDAAWGRELTVKYYSHHESRRLALRLLKELVPGGTERSRFMDSNPDLVRQRLVALKLLLEAWHWYSRFDQGKTYNLYGSSEGEDTATARMLITNVFEVALPEAMRLVEAGIVEGRAVFFSWGL